MKLYRIEHPESQKGMWNTLSPEGKPLVTYLTNEVMATLPMPYSEVYGTNGRRWYSAADSLELLDLWFKAEDIYELIAMGFDIFELEADEVQELPNEFIFTKESVTSWVDITDQFCPKVNGSDKKVSRFLLRAFRLEEEHTASGGTVCIGRK